MTNRLAVILIALSFAPHALGEVGAILPLRGYHRPGMYMPVKTDGATAGTPIEITGDGIVTTRITGPQVAPVLVTRSISQLAVNGANVDTAFNMVPGGARLVGSAVAKPRAADSAAIVVPLDPLDPVPGPAIAWEALDELVLDAAAAQRIGDAKLLELLAEGLTIVVTDVARPAGSLPWRREGDAWVAHPPLHGPRGSVFTSAMLPIAGWKPGLSEAFRRNTLLAAALFSILATGAALWPTKHPALAVAAIVVVSVVAAHAWKSNQTAVTTVGGSILVEGKSLTQVDAWTYYLAMENTTITLPTGARPVAESVDTLAQLKLTLIAPDVFECRLPRGERLASLRRTMTDGHASRIVQSTLPSPLMSLAKAGYTHPGATIIGSIPAHPWAAVVLRTSDP